MCLCVLQWLSAWVGFDCFISGFMGSSMSLCWALGSVGFRVLFPQGFKNFGVLGCSDLEFCMLGLGPTAEVVQLICS